MSSPLASPTDLRSTSPTGLAEIALLFLKLGTTAFGGPAAHVAMLEDEVVRRRRWLTREQFLDYLGATSLIPGPNSTELAIHIGRVRGGWPGLLVAGACFILPAALIVSAIGWVYVRFGALPAVNGVLYGVKPVVIAVVLQALWGLGRSAVKSPVLAVLCAVAIAAAAVGMHELLILFGAALLMAAGRVLARGSSGDDVARSRPALVGVLLRQRPFANDTSALVMSATGATAAAVPFGLWPLFLVFLKIGSVLFGSGYVLLAFLRADLVTRLGWLTERQLLDAIVVGQVTPGPVFTTATFVGYVLGGASGAAVATIGIFLPAFVFVALSAALVPRIRRSPVAGAALDGVNVASLALMAVVTAQLVRSALVDPLTIALALASVVALVRFRVGSAWLVLAGAALGLALR